MKFERKICKGIKDNFDTCEFRTLAEAKTYIEELFYANDNYASSEEKYFENGKVSLSLKNRGNKILYQLKSIL